MLLIYVQFTKLNKIYYFLLKISFKYLTEDIFKINVAKFESSKMFDFDWYTTHTYHLGQNYSRPKWSITD